MSKKYQHRPHLRSSVREYLQMLKPGRFATVKMIAEGVNRLVPDIVNEDEITSILGWLQDRDLVHVIENPDLDRKEWFLSDLGRQRLSIPESNV